MLVKQLSSFSTKHRTSFVQQICVCQTVWLTTEFGDWCRNVCPQHQRLKEMPHGNNGAFFRAYTLKPALFRATNSLPRKTRCFMSFPLCYLKANKVSKSEGTRTVEHAYNFLKVCSCRLPKIIKISPCLSKLQLAKVGMFFRHSVRAFITYNKTLRYVKWKDWFYVIAKQCVTHYYKSHINVTTLIWTKQTMSTVQSVMHFSH